MTAGDGKRRRPRVPAGRRPHQIAVRLSDEESSLIEAASGRTGTKAAAWLVETGVRAAQQPRPADKAAGPATLMPDLLPGLDLDAAQRATLKANLVRMTDIVDRTGTAVSTVSQWKAGFADWPDPLVPPRGGTRSTGAIYWWPDVEKFLRIHSLLR